MSVRYVYAFELRGIQGFLFNTGRLRDMIQASELIDYVCGQPLDKALSIVGADPEQPQPRRAGGAAYLAMDDQVQAQRLRDLWNLTVRQLLPGIELVDTIAQGESVKDAVNAALKELQVARNQPLAQLPVATPLSALAPRTGEPAITMDKGELIDRSTATRRQAQRTGAGLASRFSSEELTWPNNFESDAHASQRFPLNSDNLVGMLHLDGNGIGQLLRKLNEAAARFDDQAYIKAYQAFSQGLEQATCEAARAATSEVLVNARNHHGVLPARPLVLGGDDLSILVRSDLAVPFAQSFARHYEQKSVEFIATLKATLGDVDLPDKLTASGGLVVVKPGFPFSQAFRLSENFCDIAKAEGVNENGEKVSALSMHRVQAAAGDEASSLLAREKLVSGRDGGAGIELGLRAYGLTDDSSSVLPPIDVLTSVVNSCLSPAFSKARLRGLLDLFYQNPSLAKSEYTRWREVASNPPDDSAAGYHAFNDFERGLERLAGGLDANLPHSAGVNKRGFHQTALTDVLMLLEAQMVSPEQNAREEA